MDEVKSCLTRRSAFARVELPLNALGCLSPLPSLVNWMAFFLVDKLTGKIRICGIRHIFCAERVLMYPRNAKGGVGLGFPSRAPSVVSDAYCWFLEGTFHLT